MLPGLEMVACPNLAVSPEVMQHIVRVESSANPYAIGVVGGQLVRQPSNLGEALATVQMLNAKGYNYSLGLSQVNRANLGRYGLDSYEKAFDRCANLSAGAHILADCYKSAGRDWGKAFSCYYSGNFTTGFREGYVQKVFASINASANKTRMQPQQAIALLTTSTPTAVAPNTIAPRTTQILQTEYAPGSSGYRVALRSLAIDKAASATVTAMAAALTRPPSATTSPPTDLADNASAGNGNRENQTSIQQAGAQTTTDPSSPRQQSVSVANAGAGTNNVFVPQVTGPDDPVDGIATTKSSEPFTPQTSEIANAAVTSGGQRDAAFVF